MRTNEPIAGGSTASRRDISLLSLVKVITYKRVLLLGRYPINTASQLVMFLMLFGLIVFGGRAVAGPSFSQSLEGIVVGYFLWLLAMAAFDNVAHNISNEAQWGTLERLYMSPYRFSTVMSVNVVVNLGISIGTAIPILLGEMMIAGVWLSLDPITVVPILLVTLLSAIGIGFGFAGLALVYKRVENAFSIVQFGLVGLVGAPVGQLAWLKLLPLSQGSHLLRLAITGGVRLWEFPLAEFAVFIAVNIGYLTLGYLLFSRAVSKARRDGLLGHY